MQNKALAQVFQLTHQLMELHGDNKFKSRSYGNAAFRIGRMERQLAEVPYDGLEAVDGIGKSLAGKIVELLETGELAFLNEMLAKTPAGVVDMLSIKGIGPKQIGVIWRELGVESLGELLYACHENRLVDLKGFGAKTQELVRQNIEFRISNAGKFHYATVEPVAEALVQRIKAELNLELVAATGAVRRQCEVVDGLDILVGDPAYAPGSDADWGLEIPIGVNILTCTPEDFVAELFRSSADPEHLARLQPDTLAGALDEAAIYRNNGLPYIVPEMREGGMEFDWAAANAPDDLVQTTDLKGILHNHSTWSDGRHSLTEMAEYCQELGFEYLGICDHSRSAFYANGLDAERVAAQHEEIDALNARLAPFRVFKGIESDILNDGSLDYEPSVLASFDFIVASVHSNLRMEEAKATSRLITAIENPYTTILGHPTGRLLLSREGYPIDHRKVIDACAANGVVIELNANPFRLDLDWRWIPYAMEKGVPVSINPDAHSKEGYHHMYFGVCAARKGGLTTAGTFNALSREEIEVYFQEHKPA